MALLNVGSLADFSVTPIEATTEPADSFAVLAPRASDSKTERPLKAVLSPEPRGLTLQSLTLDREFQSLLTRLLKKTSDVYFLAWAWDLSGEPPFLYPGAGAGPGTCIIPLRGDESREFLGDGTLLFPEQTVTGGIALRFQLWESKGKTRDFGEAMVEAAEIVRKSHLTELLAVLSAATGLTTAALAGVQAAAVELASLIGSLLAKRSDQNVDYYEGYFAASKPWTPATEARTGVASEIVLNRLGQAS
jgi:hypothetical protein